MAFAADRRHGRPPPLRRHPRDPTHSGHYLGPGCRRVASTSNGGTDGDPDDDTSPDRDPREGKPSSGVSQKVLEDSLVVNDLHLLNRDREDVPPPDPGDSDGGLDGLDLGLTALEDDLKRLSSRLDCPTDHASRAGHAETVWTMGEKVVQQSFYLL